MSSLADIDLRISDDHWQTLPEISENVSGWVSALLKTEGTLSKPAALCIVLSDNETVAKLNSSWRNKPEPTNILSFPAPPGEKDDNGHQYLGDLILAWDVVSGQAKAQGKALETHLCHLVIHGVLHLIGYTHDEEEAAKKMEQLETEVLGALGMPDPY